MELRNSLEHTGHWLFRWRSYLPLTLFLPLALELPWFDWPLHSYRLQVLWECLCLLISLTGLTVRIVTVAHVPGRTSGRNTSHQVADSLNVTGIYSLIRHPLYLGNLLMWAGVVLFFRDWKLVAIYLLAFSLYYERIMAAEEQFLRQKFGRLFEEWANRTAAVIPNFAHWQPAEFSFCWRTVLRREFHGLFGLVLTFFLLDAITDFRVTHQLHFQPVWTGLLAVNLAVYLFLRTLKKRTQLLNVAGR